jgi:hypothetical protein
MATSASLTLDVLEMIFGQTKVTRPDVDQLSASVSSASDTSWLFDQAGNQFWRRGDYAEYFDGTGTAGEVVMLVAHHEEANTPVEVLRAQRRTTAASSYAAGKVFLRNPPYTHTEIQRAIDETIDSDLQRGIWYRSNRTITYQTDRNRYALDSADLSVERVYQIDVEATEIGAATFDVTGGASEDLWTTSSAHGLSVGDPVRFSAVGTLAEPYAVGVIYWVAAVPSTTTFQLSATESTTVLEGTGSNSAGTWTLELVERFDYHEYSPDDYEIIHGIATSKEGTGKAIAFRSFFDTGSLIHYDARSRPDSDSISSLPREITNLIPWGAIARLTGGTATRQRHLSAADQSAISYTDSQFFKSRFEEMVAQTRSRLLREIRPKPKWQAGPISV